MERLLLVNKADTLLDAMYHWLFSNSTPDQMIYYLNGVVDGMYVTDHEDKQWYIDMFYAACEIRERNYE